jgi:pimeloyl-ACP methyl ester carboxylesterase
VLRAIIQLILLFLTWLLAAESATTGIWTVLAFDPKGDVRDSSRGDVAQLSYRYESAQDMLWFRVSFYGAPNLDAFDVNVAVDTGADDASKMNWWGGNADFRFDKLMTAEVGRVNGRYEGTIGVSDAVGARIRNLTNLRQNNLQIRVEGGAILIGVKRTDLTDAMKMNVIASVGSEQSWNDDVPNTRSAPVDLAAPRPSRFLREIDVNRNNFQFATGYTILPENRPPQIVEKGSGRQVLILIPGVYSGEHAFDGFITRNESRFKFYVVTPPGLNRTAARELPPETTSYGEFTWTRRLERDIRELIRREKIEKPILVAHGFPGSLAAESLAADHSVAVGGIIEIAGFPVQSFPSMTNPNRQATPDERIAVVNEGWAKQWFKYVTPETWESNNYPADMFANDPDRAENARRQVEAAPLPVKIRYLTEFMASDHTDTLMNLDVPVLALRPGFNDKVLASPSNGFFKLFFLDSWEPFSKSSRIQVKTMPDARVLMLDDQPTMADQAITTFVDANVALKSDRR